MARGVTEPCDPVPPTADTDISALIRRSFRAVGRTDDTEVTAFIDGGPGLRSILVDAGITTPPILDWFHIAMRIQRATQTASGLPADGLDRMQAKSAISNEVERLRWRIWNGKAKNAKRSIGGVRKVMHDYKEERSHNMRSAPSHRPWHALLHVDGYLRGQSSWLTNYPGPPPSVWQPGANGLTRPSRVPHPPCSGCSH
jgi:hypothetical protein